MPSPSTGREARPTLTIGQLAAYVGVTVRAVRHYHQCGLLAEPVRDASGYRRYGGADVVDLIRIRTLAAAGVPLVQIEELLHADPEDFAQAIAELDQRLAVRIRDLEDHRRRIAGLVGGERLFLPPEVVDVLAHLRALGVSERAVQIERDGWIVLQARAPEEVPAWATEKASQLADPAFRELYLAFDEAYDWDPADPRLAELADAVVAYVEQLPAGPARDAWTVDDLTAALVRSPARGSAAYARLDALCRERMAATGAHLGW